MAQVAKQVEFDHIVKELLEGGSDWHEAVQEALETFQESSYDLTALYLYTSKLEFEEKEKAEKRCRTVEEVVKGKDTVVNLTFALQGLSQTIRCNNNNSKGTLILTEHRKLPQNLILVLANLSKEEDDEEMNESHGEDSDEEDEEENLIRQKDSILEFLLFYIAQPPTSFRNYPDLLLLDETIAQAVLCAVDGTSDQPKPLEKLLDLIAHINKHPINKDLLTLSGVVQVLDLAKKMNKKNATIASKVDALLAQF